jgi:3-polyprenyl-4-hydroxybenzoate decarboxylase
MKIDKYQCKHLKSSLELTKTKMSKDRNGSSKLEKDKSSEKKLQLKNLPMFSTNFSDAFKYLIYRPEWIRLADKKSGGTLVEPEVV